MSDADAARLGVITEYFFKEVGGLGLSVQKLQGFMDDFKATGPGGSTLFPARVPGTTPS